MPPESVTLTVSSLSGEAAVLRQRVDAVESSLRPDGGDGTGAVSYLCKTTTITTYPTTASAYYAVVQCDAGGAETEGTAGVISAIKGKFLAFNLGSTIPPASTPVLVTRAGGRWIFRYDA